MKNAYAIRYVSWFGLLLLSLTGCLKDSCESTQVFYQYVPVYMSEADLRAGLELTAPRPMENTGKIYVYQHYLLINELDEGIHIIDNSDPSHPAPVSFLSIPGNVDMAVYGDMLYADSYVDLVTIDISDPATPRLASRNQNVFPGLGRDPIQGVVIRYEPTEVTRTMPCGDNRMWFWEGADLFTRPFVNAGKASGAISVAAATAVGIGGSLARFTIASDHLYTIDNFQLHVFDLAKRSDPRLVRDLPVGWQIETIFPYGDNLFIGSRAGMFIYDNSTPTEPVQLAVFEHARACDPVFIDGDIAYVTLRDGTECESFANQLEVVDISDLRRPNLLRIYPMHHPIGLSVSDNHLYLCEDDQGLKVFNVEDVQQIDKRQVAHLEGFTATDVITLDGDNIAIVVGKEGVHQFDISDPGAIKKLSTLSITN